MAIEFDPGYGAAPFRALCESYPGAAAYPPAHFRVEWGPVFHRGRLDGTARVLVLGQDPAPHEAVVRRILVGEAGHRVQGLLAKLGIERRYVLVNTFLYSMYGKGGAARVHAPLIETYRNRWLDALLATSPIEAVVALGGLADAAWNAYRATTAGSSYAGRYARVTHPTWPESSTAANPAGLEAAIRTLLVNWNAALSALHPLPHADTPRPLVPYGDGFRAEEKPPVPLFDLPPGLPSWMGADDGWAARSTRATIRVTVPEGGLP